MINGCRCRFASIRVACIPTKILDSSTGCGPRQSHIHRPSRIPSIHRKIRTYPSENQIRKIQGEFEAPPSFTLQGRADCPRACINQYSWKHTKRGRKTRALRRMVLAVMIVGNPKTGKRAATAAVALLLMILIVTTIVSLRKRTAPAKEPPLHPSVVILAIS